MSIRTNLRNDVVTVLKAALITGVGSRVFEGAPATDVDADNLPEIYVTTPSSTVEVIEELTAIGSRELMRETEVQVMILDRWSVDTPIENDLDIIAQAVEVALRLTPTSGLTGWNLAAEDTETRLEGDTLYAEHIMTYRTLYKTPEGSHNSIV